MVTHPGYRIGRAPGGKIPDAALEFTPTSILPLRGRKLLGGNRLEAIPDSESGLPASLLGLGNPVTKVSDTKLPGGEFLWQERLQPRQANRPRPWRARHQLVPSPGGRGLRGGGFQGFQNLLQHAINVVENLRIPESQNTKSHLLQNAIPFLVSHPLACMLAAIHLNHQSFFVADKIHDEGPQRFLPAELYTQRPPAKFAPEKTLGVGHVPP